MSATTFGGSSKVRCHQLDVLHPSPSFSALGLLFPQAESKRTSSLREVRRCQGDAQLRAHAEKDGEGCKTSSWCARTFPAPRSPRARRAPRARITPPCAPRLRWSSQQQWIITRQRDGRSSSFWFVRASPQHTRPNGSDSRHIHILTLTDPQPTPSLAHAENRVLHAPGVVVRVQDWGAPMAHGALRAPEHVLLARRPVARRGQRLAMLAKSRFSRLSAEMAICDASGASCACRVGPYRCRAVPYAPWTACMQRGGRWLGAGGRMRRRQSRRFCDFV